MIGMIVSCHHYIRQGIRMKEKIGAFKALTGISEATLRFYERLGLVTPDRDAENDYRYYDELNFLEVAQARQLTSFDITLGELPAQGRDLPVEGMLEILSQKRIALEKQLEDLYERLARIKLHEKFFRPFSSPGIVTKANILGIYRLFVSDPEVAAHPDTEATARRWLSYAPFAHSTIRIRLSDILSGDEGPFSVAIGVGLLERYFIEAGETYRAPMQCSPPSMSLQGSVTVDNLRGIRRKDLEPFLSFMSEASLIPQDDMFGWVVYVGREGGKPRYHLSLRISVA